MGTKKNKKSFALRIDPKLLVAIEKWAADEFRSVNGQIEWIINRALQDTGRLKIKNETDNTVIDTDQKIIDDTTT